MPLNLSSVNTNRQKFIVRNLTNTILSIGDLKIILKPSGSFGSSIDLFSESEILKNSFRTMQEIESSSELDTLLKLKKIEIETEEGILSNGEKYLSKVSASLYDIDNSRSILSNDTRYVNMTLATSIWTSEIVDYDLNLGVLKDPTTALLGFFNGLDKDKQANESLSANKFIINPSSGMSILNPFFWGTEVLGTNTYAYIKVFEDYKKASLSFETYSNSGFSPSRMFKVPYPGKSYNKIISATTATTDGFSYEQSVYGILVGYLQGFDTGVFELNKKVQLSTAWLYQLDGNTICRFRFHNASYPTAPTNQIDMTVAIYE